ncbi:MAG: isoleucine--tRNA ligase [Nanohaloarchaea archaeon]|nr:isoleucine--tRNA ligase [Candidatus Nanohaloarchaea archaeon]
MTDYNPEKVESKVKKNWKQDNTRRKALEKNKGGEIFYFLDGPPYPTGSMHMGTAMGKILKDYFIRFHRMNGYYVHAQPGYDTHGLPIENKVEEQEGFENKQDIEDFGVANFIDECKDFATEYIDDMNQDFKEMGVWMDWENPYLTLHNYYIEGAWETFEQAYKKGFLYEDSYPVHVCTRCETAVAYNEVEYMKKEDPEVYVTLPVKDRDEELMIWTTTPWTIPSNTGVMVHPEFEYSLVEFDGRKIWMASELLEDIMNKLGYEEDEYKIVEIVKGEELEDTEYEHPLEEEVPAQENVQGRVVLSERYVDLSGGTGLVHSAPGHGKEDYEIGQENDLPQISPVDLKGHYTSEAGKYEEMFVKDADEQIKKDLKEKGNLIFSDSIRHEYPKCWRCDTPLLQLSIPQWFFGATKFRDKLLDENDKVNWVPDWAGDKFDEWLEQLGDWPVSRQRYWGIPLPIWECNDCDHTHVVGSRDELPADLDDLHRPYIDEVELECDDCGGTMTRIPDVLDVWFDSGVAPWASLKHPDVDFTFEEEGPVDLEEEGFDQIRGWWNSQFITSIMTHDTRPFDNVIYHGKVKLEGKEMSKSKGIIVRPEEVIEKYGRDLLRYYILTKDVSEDWSWEWDEVEESFDFMNLLWNTYEYKDTYTSEVEKPENLELEDRWILSRLNTMIENVQKYSSEPKFTAFKAVNHIEEFAANDLSRTYIKMIRERLKPGYEGDDRQAAEWTLRKVTDQLLKVLAPFTPYFADYHWNGNNSIHLEDYADVNDEQKDEKLERDVAIFQDVQEAVARLRQEKGISLRHPVKEVTVSGSNEVESAVGNLKELFEERLNTKNVQFENVELDYEVKLEYSKAGPVLGGDVGEVESALADRDYTKIAEKIDAGKAVEIAGYELEPKMFDVRTHVPEDMDGEEFSEGTVYLDDEMTEDLLDEAFVAEIVRAIQQKRKEAELEVEDRVNLSFSGDTQPVEVHLEEVKDRVNVKDVDFGESDYEYVGVVEFEGREIEFSFSEPVA